MAILSNYHNMTDNQLLAFTALIVIKAMSIKAYVSKIIDNNESTLVTVICFLKYLLFDSHIGFF